MQADDLIEKVQGHYVPQLAGFIARQRQALGRGSGEVKLNWGEGSRYFRDLVCIDFAAGGDKPKFIEFGLKSWLSFPPLTATVAKSLTLEITAMRWDDVRVEHDVSTVDEAGLGRWFEYWFDLEDKRNPGGSELCDIIHRLTIEPSALEVDFGSSRSDSFWGLVEVLRSSGARHIRVSVPDAE